MGWGTLADTGPRHREFLEVLVVLFLIARSMPPSFLAVRQGGREFGVELLGRIGWTLENGAKEATLWVALSIVLFVGTVAVESDRSTAP